MISFKKKGQAALEFLTTYGWAFLVILVMISALGYFGILNPDRFLPERCNVGPEFACVEYAIYDNADPNFVLIMTNNVGQTINNMSISRVQIRTETEDNPTILAGACNITNTADELVNAINTVRAGENVIIQCNLTSDLTAQFGAVGSKVRIDMDLLYKPLGLTLPRPISSQIYATLQP